MDSSPLIEAVKHALTGARPPYMDRLPADCRDCAAHLQTALYHALHAGTFNPALIIQILEAILTVIAPLIKETHD